MKLLFMKMVSFLFTVRYWVIAIFIIAYNGLYLGKKISHAKLIAWNMSETVKKIVEPYTPPTNLPKGNKIRKFHRAYFGKNIVIFEIESFLFIANGFKNFCKHNKNKIMFFENMTFINFKEVKK
jgi:hypothetical protein